MSAGKAGEDNKVLVVRFPLDNNEWRDQFGEEIPQS